MKTSRYNKLFRGGENCFAYNALTNSLVRIDQWLYDCLSTGNLEEIGPVIESELRRGGFVIDDDFDELTYLRFRYDQMRFSSDHLSLTIAPTLDCNFNCPYCYQEHLKVFMDEKTQGNVIRFVEKRVEVLRPKSISVVWYGGEPLMAKPTIFSMSERFLGICSGEDISYRAEVVTNGSLLNEDLVGKLKQYCVTRIQVTIDGPREVHNARRPFKNGKGSFDVIMKNVDRLIGLIPLHIRINVDKRNVNQAIALIQELHERGWFDPNREITFNFAPVVALTDVCSSIAGDCYSSQEFSEVERRIIETLHQSSIRVSTFPGPYRSCVATGVNCYLVDPRGYLFKCWNIIGQQDQAIGNVSYPLRVDGEFLRWSSFDPFAFEACLSCKILPLCMGGCPYHYLEQRGEPEQRCRRLKYHLADLLQLHVTRKEGIGQQNYIIH